MNELHIFNYMYQFIKYIECIKWANAFTCLQRCLVHGIHSVNISYFHSFIYHLLSSCSGTITEKSLLGKPKKVICVTFDFPSILFASHLLDYSLYGVRDISVSSPFVCPVPRTGPDIFLSTWKIFVEQINECLDIGDLVNLFNHLNLEIKSYHSD